MLSATTYVSQLHKYSISEDSGEEEVLTLLGHWKPVPFLSHI